VMKSALKILAGLGGLLVTPIAGEGPLPVVLWHGMGDNCCNVFSMGSIKSTLEITLGTYVHSVRIGDSAQEDTLHGFLDLVDRQVDYVCDVLRADPMLANGFNAIGFSQGGQFLRAYVQRCNNPPVHNLISVGGQHQGVAGFPRCKGPELLCNTARALLNVGAYVPFVQRRLVQAQYWHDPHAARYRRDNIFLPGLNNELATKNETYKRNLMSLNKFVMVKFSHDTMVTPRESEWFEFYADGDASTIVPLRDSALYKEDWLGLQAMDQANQLVFLESPGDHLQLPLGYFQTVLMPFLNTTTSAVS